MTMTTNGEENKGLQRVAIDPVTRVEGHGKVTLWLDEAGFVQEARLHIVEFRGFEKFIQGRPYEEVPILVQRLCGICPVSHHLAGAKAIDRIAGIQQIPPTAEKIRKLLHFAQVLQSHATHFFHLASPDLLFGADDDPLHRNIVGLAVDQPAVLRDGVLVRRYGQSIIETLSGKRIHGTLCVPGGVNKTLAAVDRGDLKNEIVEVIAAVQRSLQLAETLYYQKLEENQRFGWIQSPMLSLTGPQGQLELYDGGLCMRAIDGSMILNHVEDTRYSELLREQVRPWSYMKFPFLEQLGPDAGWYRVGPLPRVNNCSFIDTDLAEASRKRFMDSAADPMIQSPMAYHWARMIESLHCVEAIDRLLDDPEVLAGDRVASGQPCFEGVGVIEAPRGTLIHHYQIDDDGLIKKANLIVSTTHNNQAMNETIRTVSRQYIDGHELTERLLNRVEIAIRAYDPCLSCATHALGQMPLELELRDGGDRILHGIRRRDDGTIEKRE